MKQFIVVSCLLIALSLQGSPYVNQQPQPQPQPMPPQQPCLNGMCGGYDQFGGYPYGWNPWGYDYGYGFEDGWDWDDNDWDDNDWDYNDGNYHRPNHRPNHSHSSTNRPSTGTNRPSTGTNPPSTGTSRPSTGTNRPTTGTTSTRDLSLGMGFIPMGDNNGYINLGNNMPFGPSGRQGSENSMVRRQGINASPEQCKIAGLFKQLCMKKEAVPIADAEQQYVEYYDCFSVSACRYVNDECKWLHTKKFDQCLEEYKQYVAHKH